MIIRGLVAVEITDEEYESLFEQRLDEIVDNFYIRADGVMVQRLETGEREVGAAADRRYELQVAAIRFKEMLEKKRNRA